MVCGLGLLRWRTCVSGRGGPFAIYPFSLVGELALRLFEQTLLLLLFGSQLLKSFALIR
jgi:hypothetical protein